MAASSSKAAKKVSKSAPGKGANRGPATIAERYASMSDVIRSDKKDLPAIAPEKLQSARALRPPLKRFHGAKIPLRWFPWWLWRTPCSDKFGYLTPKAVRAATKLPFNAANRTLLEQLGEFMADPSRGPGADSAIPAGFTYFGQFVDHDITLDVDSKLEVETDATTISNMRSPSLDLDSVYGGGPALDPFLYVFPTAGPPTAIRMLLGVNRPTSPGGPRDSAGQMSMPTTSDVPRVSTNTAIIGDPRNDENLIVSQFHFAMLRFHNAVVDATVASGFGGDIFVEAKRTVTHHYQWAVVHDFLKRICGQAAVTAALGSVSAAPNSKFAMPVEFSVAAYRFGHSMIREQYTVNDGLVDRSLGEIFAFIRNPLLPVLSNWVIDFNGFFDTGLAGPIPIKAAKIDSVLAPGLDLLPGFTGMMQMLAIRNLVRGLALGLPSGQGVAQHFGVPAMTAAQLKQGIPAGEAALLDSQNGILLSKTPLWYYVLREAAVIENGERLGPVGARIVAETFVRMLKRDPDSMLNKSGGFTPNLASATPGDFTVADLINFAGVTVP